MQHSFLSNVSITSILHGMPVKISAVPGTLITIPANEPTSNYGRFMSWNAKSDGSGTKYLPGDTIADGYLRERYARGGSSLSRLVALDH